MNALIEAKQSIAVELKKALGQNLNITPSELEVPPDTSLGDLAFPCFVPAKGLGKNPAELAKELAKSIKPHNLIAEVSAAGPYVNFRLSTSAFGKLVIDQIQKDKNAYGISDAGKGVRVMVEYAQPNTHKQIHVGHLRNFFVGHSVVEILRRNGYEALPTSYINDLGAHVATCLYGLSEFFGSERPKKREERIALLAKAYQKGTEAALENPEAKKAISAIYKDLEELKGPYYKDWKITRKWSLEYFEAIFKELGLPIDIWYFESDLIDETKTIIEELIEKGIAAHSEGAWIVDLQEENLGVNLLVKSDGTLLYNAKDLGLARQKEEDHHPKKSLYIIDARQSLAMQQLFTTLKRMGFSHDLQHLSYEFVTLKGGAMSSRKGNVITYTDFRDAMIKMAMRETQRRHPDWSDAQLDTAAKGIAFAAMHFGMLKQDLDKKIVFDLDEAVSFEGATGPYLLYSYARIESVLKKAPAKLGVFDASQLTHASEHALLLHLAQFPLMVFDTGVDLKVSRIAQYTFDLCKAFSEYYNEVPILSDETYVGTRLGTVRAVQQVLENCFSLLGIKPLREM